MKNQEYLVIDESEISCKNLPLIAEAVAQARLGMVLVMPVWQLREGLRGFAKAQIIRAIHPEIVQTLGMGEQQLQALIRRESGVFRMGPLHKTNERCFGVGISKHNPEIQETDLPQDRRWMKKAKELIDKSNCWYFPTACVFVRNGRVACEGVSTSYNHSECKKIPMSFTDLKLNDGERLIFCDSQHAEQQGVSAAAARGVSLEGTTMYLQKFPCRPCMQALIGAGVKRMVYEIGSYGLPDLPLLLKNGIEVQKLTRQV